MAYEMYKKQWTKEQYFKSWNNSPKLKILTEEIKQTIYHKYLVKCEVLKRDNFKCRNIRCRTSKEDLTMHHVKWQKNGGKDSVRNCITICASCHNKYHNGKMLLEFPKDNKLPSHISGHTFEISKEDSINWKKVKIKMKIRRREVRDMFGLKLTTEQWNALFTWLFKNFGNDI